MDDIGLDQLRMARGFKQAHLASAMNMSQAAVSKLEFRTDSYISSVRRYVEAIGGRLELHAIFPDQEFRLRGLDGNDTIASIRALLEKPCRITPLSPAEGNFNNSFRLRFIDDDERQITVEKDTGQIIQIPIRRILEVLPEQAPWKVPTLVLRGQIVWFPETERWRFVESEQ
jgi:transcriptional regulator with XRE-family HTH domain